METRILQRVGKSTLTISLPKDWVIKANLKRGDLIFLNQEEDGSLRVISKKLAEELEKTKDYYFDCDKMEDPKLLERLIAGAYVSGADSITIFCSKRISGNKLEEIRNISRKMISLNIMEESQNNVKLLCTIDPTKFEINSLVKQLFVIVSTMLDEALQALLTLNIGLAKDVIKREEAANSMVWLILRLVLIAEKTKILADKIGLARKLSPSIVGRITSSLERIADCSERISIQICNLYKMGSTLNKKETEGLSFLSKKIKEVFQKAVESFLSGNLKVANSVINYQQNLESEINSQKTLILTPFFYAIAALFVMIADHSTTIAAVVIDNELDIGFQFIPKKLL